jgi:acyl-CoA reductase-like NAD-dependent aldehyde dehydrogenase
VQQLYIDGKWQDGLSSYRVISPWDGSTVGRVASASAEQAEAAVAAAANAAPLAAHERAAVLLRVSRLIEERAEQLAQSITAEAGKPISAARVEVARAVGTFELSSGEARRLGGEAVPMDALPSGEGMLAMTIPQPVGPVAAITPFNFPLNLVAHKLGPALAAGCPVVLKPSEKTPLTAGLLTQIFDDAGLTPGWLNLVTGDPEVVVNAWLADPRIALVTFTGSTRIGRLLKDRSPAKRHVLELGSNTAMVVSDHADLDLAVRSAVASAFGYSGQTCISLQRVYVTPNVAAGFTERLAAAADDIIAGNPNDERTAVGPLITAEATARVQSWIDEATRGGAIIRAGGKLEGGVLRPTVLADVASSAQLICEEAFGPVVSVNTVPTISEAVRQVNSSRFGLNTAIFTNDINEAMAFAKAAEAGTVLVNVAPGFRADHMPYGGVKQSGEGREGIRYAVQSMLDHKLLILEASRSL